MADSWQGIEVEYPQAVYDSWLEQHRPILEAYAKAKAEYEAEKARRKPILDQYSRDLNAFQAAKQQSAKEWAKAQNIKLKRSNSGKSLKKDWLERLEKQGFKYGDSPPTDPFVGQPLKAPACPEVPSRTYRVTFEDYLPGSLPEVEAALAWVSEFAKDLIPETLCEINDDWICGELDERFLELTLAQQRQEVLGIFSDVLSGQLTDPRAIWNLLTSYDFDYEPAIGMRSHYVRQFRRTVHNTFGPWHEINLSLTGHWLIEFQGIHQPEISFHLPYDRRRQLNFDCDWEALPRWSSEQAHFGREVNDEEQEAYPIEALVQVFGKTASDFPRGLKEYDPPFWPRYEDWDAWEEGDGDADSIEGSDSINIGQLALESVQFARHRDY